MQTTGQGETLLFDNMDRLLVVTRRHGGQVACRFYWRARMSQLSHAARVAESSFCWDDPGLWELESPTTQSCCRVCNLLLALIAREPYDLSDSISSGCINIYLLLCTHQSDHTPCNAAT